MRFFGKTKINFLKQWKVCVVISILLIAASMFSLVIKGGPAYNIDFAGGTLVQIRYVKQASISEVRAEMKKIGYGDAIIQEFGNPNDILIRVSAQKEVGTEEESISDKIIRGLKTEKALKDEEDGKIDLNNADKKKILGLFDEMYIAVEGENQVDTSKLASQIVENRTNSGGLFTDISQVIVLPGFTDEIYQKVKNRVFLGDFIIERVEMVGPKVGKDLRGKALFAISCAIIALLFYVTVRFELVFALGAVVALVHDVLITLGIFSMFDKEISLQIIAAFLTVAGYSINDTIVVFDRAKENFVKSRTKLNIMDFDNRMCFETFNLSINQTLGRTVLTSGTTFLVVSSLFLFGGAVIHDFAFAILVGIITGTYSSIYVASTIVYGINYVGRRKKGFVDTTTVSKKIQPPKTRIKKSAGNAVVSEKALLKEKKFTNDVPPEKKISTAEVPKQVPTKTKTRGKSRTKDRDKAKSKAKKKNSN